MKTSEFRVGLLVHLYNQIEKIDAVISLREKKHLIELAEQLFFGAMEWIKVSFHIYYVVDHNCIHVDNNVHDHLWIQSDICVVRLIS